ncbi:hypothetical protein PMIN01_12446 [Paraphaeosphaeria minitans]|uniref:Uncharacterized protein n=1 Tax=Paraphaeosphaeria minitans TaxID=565426 RepID=A0A9P6G658_9PLEO|nr:hypothetical protein PMIN01_12446 [Paraphaeosphaeria minitans]
MVVPTVLASSNRSDWKKQILYPCRLFFEDLERCRDRLPTDRIDAEKSQSSVGSTACYAASGLSCSFIPCFCSFILVFRQMLTLERYQIEDHLSSSKIRAHHIAHLAHHDFPLSVNC